MRHLPRSGPLVAVLLLIGLATLVPLGEARPRFFWGFDWSDLLVNLVLYLPLGFLLAKEDRGAVGIAAVALLLAGAIELLQGTAIVGRRGSLVDVAANFLGAMLGMATWLATQRLRRAPSRSMIAGAAALALLPVIAWGVSGPLLAPWPPETRRWWGQWAHLFVGTEPFRGSILAVALLGHEIPDDQVDSTPALFAQARRGTLALEVRLVAGGTTDGVTHLVSVADGEGHIVIGMDQLGDDLLLTWWSKGASLGLRAPRLLFPGVLGVPAGERISVVATVSRARASVEVSGSRLSGVGGRRRLTPLMGWRNLLPSGELSAGAQRAFDIVWTLGLLGYVLVVVRVLRAKLREL